MSRWMSRWMSSRMCRACDWRWGGTDAWATRRDGMPLVPIGHSRAFPRSLNCNNTNTIGVVVVVTCPPPPEPHLLCGRRQTGHVRLVSLIPPRPVSACRDMSDRPSCMSSPARLPAPTMTAEQCQLSRRRKTSSLQSLSLPVHLHLFSPTYPNARTSSPLPAPRPQYPPLISP
jgi:hypothetical protein